MRYGYPDIESVDVGVYAVPTDQPEADGTLAWTATTMVLVEVRAGERSGLGRTYAGAACAAVLEQQLSAICVGASPIDVPGLNERMARACRNLGRSGLVACAISAVDIALWDLKARLLKVPLTALFGQVRADVPAYGSGGFTTYDEAATRAQLERWVEGWRIPRVKIKIGESWGANVQRDLGRVALAREVVGEDVGLYVAANGGYSRKQAVRMGQLFYKDQGVTWFEEPVSSDDLAGLREVRSTSATTTALRRCSSMGPSHPTAGSWSRPPTGPDVVWPSGPPTQRNSESGDFCRRALTQNALKRPGVIMAKAKTAADNLCERLIEGGTDTIYGSPGDGINGIWARYVATRTDCGSSRPAMRRWHRSWRAGTPSLPDRSGCARPRRGQRRSIGSTGSMTPNYTISRWWPLSARPSCDRWEATSSKRSTCCSPTATSPRRGASRSTPPRRSATSGPAFPYRAGRTDRDVRQQKLDTPFTDPDRDPDERAWTRLAAPDGTCVELWVDEHYPIIEIYTGDTLSPPRRLQSDQSLASTWGVRLNRQRRRLRSLGASGIGATNV